MIYKIYIDASKVLSIQGLIKCISCFGSLGSENKKELVWKVDPSIIHIDCALEYLKRIVDDSAILRVEEEHMVRRRYKRQENTKRKQGFSKRKRK